MNRKRCYMANKREEELKLLDEMLSLILRHGELPIKSSFDISKYVSMAQKGGVLTALDLDHVANDILTAQKLNEYFAKIERSTYPLLLEKANELFDVSPLEKEIHRVISPSLNIYDNASPELHKIRKEITRLENEVRSSARPLIAKYKDYLSKINNKIQSTLKQQLQVLRENNLSAKDCYNAIMKKTRHLWCRELLDDDFLRIRLGIGDISSFINVQAPEEHFSLYTDNLQELVYEIDRSSKRLQDAPVTVSLTSQTILSFILNCSYGIDYMNGLLLQILALQSSLELKIVIFTNKQNE